MMTRLVLVSMVAALGITIPTWSEVGGCITALHSWTACRLADWDVARGRREETGVAIPIFRESVRVFEPIVPDDASRDIAYELNRMSDGLDVRSAEMVANRRVRDDGVRSPAASRERAAFSWITTIETTEEKLMTELVGAIEQSHDEVATATRRPKSPIDPPISCVFAASPKAPAPVRKAAASADKPESRPRLSGPRFEPIEPLVAGSSDVAAVLNRFAEGIEPMLPGPLAANSWKPAFVPIDPATTRITSLADELNRLSQGVRDAPHPTVAVGQSIPEPISRRTSDSPPVAREVRPAPLGPSTEVALAMRLTRDALHAWMKVMGGPALVQVSSR